MTVTVLLYLKLKSNAQCSLPNLTLRSLPPISSSRLRHSHPAANPPSFQNSHSTLQRPLNRPINNASRLQLCGPDWDPLTFLLIPPRHPRNNLSSALITLPVHPLSAQDSPGPVMIPLVQAVRKVQSSRALPHQWTQSLHFLLFYLVHVCLYSKCYIRGMEIDFALGNRSQTLLLLPVHVGGRAASAIQVCKHRERQDHFQPWLSTPGPHLKNRFTINFDLKKNSSRIHSYLSIHRSL